MEELLRNLRYSLRALASRPGFTAAAVLSLALGIGANTAVFTAVKAIFLRPLPVEKPAELVSVYTSLEGMASYLPVSYPNFRDLRESSSSFSDLLAVTPVTLSLVTGGEPELIQGEMVSGGYFRALGVEPALGRAFRPEEDATPGTHPVIVLGHDLWRRRFGSDPGILGRSLQLNGEYYTVIGVAPRGFSGVVAVSNGQFWVPLMMHEQVMRHRVRRMFEERRATLLGVVGRLREGVGPERAGAELQAIASRLAEEYPEANEGRTLVMIPLLRSMIHPDDRGMYVRAASLLSAMAGLVLLIACANVANMLLARAAGRRREIAVRLALGASRARLVRQLLTESLVLALAAGAAGLLIALWARRLIGAFEIPFLPESLDFALDARVLAVAAGLSVLTGLLFGLVPALQTSRPELVPALKDGAEVEGGRGARRFGLRQLLVAVQVALSLVALIAASLFLFSLRNAQRIDPGFEHEKLLAVSFNLDHLGYGEERGQALLRELAARVESLPGVSAAAVAENLKLLDSGLRRTVTVEGRESADGPLIAQTNAVDLDYFEVLGIRILRGRSFQEGDRAGTTAVAVINQTMAELGWPGENPVGRRFRLKPTDDVFEVVGVAADTKDNSLGETTSPYLYLPLRQAYSPAVTLHVRTRGTPSSAAGSVLGILRGMAPGLPPPDVRTMPDIIGSLLWAPRAGAMLLALFGAVALALAIVGIYGVTSYVISQRRREIGIRVALGAKRSDVTMLFLRRGMFVVGVGLGIGLVGAFALARLISGLLFGVDAQDPVAFGSSGVLLALVALAASYIPSRKAAAVPPGIVIRQD